MWFSLQGIKAKTAAMVPDVVTKGKGKGRGKAAAAAADDEDDMVEAVAGDAEGGAALAEEAPAPGTQRVSGFVVGSVAVHSGCCVVGCSVDVCSMYLT